jgi:hypothetical protein
VNTGFKKNHILKVKMKHALLLLVIFCCKNLLAQDLHRGAVHQLKNFGLYESYQKRSMEQQSTEAFELVLNYHQKATVNDIPSTLLRTIGTISVAAGGTILISSRGSASSQGSALVGEIGAMSLGVGLVSYGISIPFRSGVKKNRQLRDQLIAELKSTTF